MTCCRTASLRELADVPDRQLGFGQVVDEEAGDAVLDGLGQAARRGGR